MLDGQGANARGVFEGEYILEVDNVRKEFPGGFFRDADV